MIVQCNDVKDVKVFLIKGHLTAGTCKIFSSELDKYIDESTRKVILDCSELDYIDSTGLGVMVKFYKNVTANGGNYVLAALQDKPRLVFEITRANRVFNIFKTVDEALRALDN